MKNTVEFLQAYRDKLENVFGAPDFENWGVERGIPEGFFEEIWKVNPMSAFIPKEYGGRGGEIAESLAVLEASSYHALSLSLAFGINFALFLQPVAKFGSDVVKKKVFSDFMRKPTLGGLMITEPDYGTDALSMQTSYHRNDDASYQIKGTKHWAGLTGQANYWLMSARERTSEGKLLRDIGLFVCDQQESGQRVNVVESFKALGLHLIGYGRNSVDVNVPEAHKLIPQQSGVRMLMSVLRRSRLQFCGMGMGFLKRMSDEVQRHSETRLVGKKALFSYDQVQARIARIQAMTTSCEAMCLYASEQANLETDINNEELPANVLKAVVTDYMQEAAQSFLQLMGASGFKLTHLAGRNIVDSRPFQIFEGSNDVLYHQISQFVLGKMRKAKETSLQSFLQTSPWKRGIQALGNASLFDFEVDKTLSQRKQVVLGKLLARAITADWLVNLANAGYRQDLIEQSLTSLVGELEQLRSNVLYAPRVAFANDFSEGKSWLELLQTSLQTA